MVLTAVLGMLKICAFIPLPAVRDLTNRGKRRRVAAAQLQGDGVFAGIKGEMTRHIAMEQGTGRHHL